MVPPAQTAEETARLPERITKNLNALTFTPRASAFSSPPFNKSRREQIKAIVKKDKKEGIKINFSSVIPLPLKLPKSQE